METNALISVIVPCYNQGIYLSDALQSVLDQSYSNWECLIVNDGSTDDTETIAKQWTSKDERFKYIFKTNGGLSSARNAGLKQAKGAFVQFLDSDDMLASSKFEQSLSLANQADIVVSDFNMFTTDITNTSPPFCQLKAELLNYEAVLTQWDNGFNIPIHCGFFSRKTLSGFEFNETLGAKEDWLLWLHVFKQSTRCAFVSAPLAYYRLHEQSMTTNKAHMHTNLGKVYAYLFHQLNPEDKGLLFRKVLDAYITEGARFSRLSAADVQDFIEINNGRKALGFVGGFLFRVLRKVGHLAGKNKKDS